jgi:hypothetical protein
MSNCGMEMPRYKCHKEVWALKIAQVIRVQFRQMMMDSRKAVSRCCVIVPEDQRYARFCVDRAYVEKHKPEAGGYYVVYDDGYKSFSPAAAFEEGYTRL